jgi:hypothetical protein
MGTDTTDDQVKSNLAELIKIANVNAQDYKTNSKYLEATICFSWKTGFFDCYKREKQITKFQLQQKDLFN